MIFRSFWVALMFTFCLHPLVNAQQKSLIFSDKFDQLQRGSLTSDLGAQTEYHYFKEARPHGQWALATFRYEGNHPDTWSVRDDSIGRFVWQKYRYDASMPWHPMMVAGSEWWKNYRAELKFMPEEKSFNCGLVFRYVNSRCYYFWGIRGDKAVLMSVNYGTGFRKSLENTLAEKPIVYQAGQMLNAWVEVKGNTIRAGFTDGPEVEVTDSTFCAGKIGLLTDIPARFYKVNVSMSLTDKTSFEKLSKAKSEEEKRLQTVNPQPVIWKKIQTPDFGSGRNLRFGDMDGDGHTDILIGQVMNHGPKDRNSELSCLTAITTDGRILWQKGTPDPWKKQLTSDVAFQIHDINHDGKNEVIYTMNHEMIVAEGATGKILKQVPTPVNPETGEQILGDCLYFCDLSGKGYPSDFIIKDRYTHLWAYNSDLQPLWNAACRTGHYPYADDIDGDGKDELMMGYTLFDHDGRVIWQKDKELQDHADGVAAVDFKGNGHKELLIAASDEGMIFLDSLGNILHHYYLGHVQNPTVANFRDDLPGLESISINFWGNQGIVHFYDSDHKIYHSFEPNHYGSMCLPVSWTGRSEEFFLHNANVDEGGMFDGWGRKVVQFPDDGHPDMCTAVLDLTGDCRDEVVVWNPSEIWIYTQNDNPKTGKLYKPKRNSLSNYSNYQATVSLPGWNQ